MRAAPQEKETCALGTSVALVDGTNPVRQKVSPAQCASGPHERQPRLLLSLAELGEVRANSLPLIVQKESGRQNEVHQADLVQSPSHARDELQRWMRMDTKPCVWRQAHELVPQAEAVCPARRHPLVQLLHAVVHGLEAGHQHPTPGRVEHLGLVRLHGYSALPRPLVDVFRRFELLQVHVPGAAYDLGHAEPNHLALRRHQVRAFICKTDVIENGQLRAACREVHLHDGGPFAVHQTQPALGAPGTSRAGRYVVQGLDGPYAPPLAAAVRARNLAALIDGLGEVH
mmetsp:Transcript_59711/g.134603  ORF Transcript_59711/g.134603 Transcript_59711/m.134603 type:complete len:286 (-) Transcript_59711:183-1040(-)